MKRLVITAALAATALTAAGAAQAQSFRAPDRADRIAERIDRGVARGDLTRREARSLHDQLRQTIRLERTYLRDGRLTGWEARDLDTRYDRLQVRVRYARRDEDRRWY
jgi:hypothetical protein